MREDLHITVWRLLNKTQQERLGIRTFQGWWRLLLLNYQIHGSLHSSGVPEGEECRVDEDCTKVAGEQGKH